jgi:Rieske Fe-S protein
LGEGKGEEVEETAPNLIPRRVINWLLGTSLAGLGGSILYPVLRFISPPDIPEPATAEVEAGFTNDPELLERGFKIVRFGAEPVILIRVGDTDFRAFSATCTHLDCIVEFQKEDQRLWCNCHNGEYNLVGANVSGPPPRPLRAYAVNLIQGQNDQPQAIVISKS